MLESRKAPAWLPSTVPHSLLHVMRSVSATAIAAAQLALAAAPTALPPQAVLPRKHNRCHSPLGGARSGIRCWRSTAGACRSSSRSRASAVASSLSHGTSRPLAEPLQAASHAAGGIHHTTRAGPGRVESGPASSLHKARPGQGSAIPPVLFCCGQSIGGCRVLGQVLGHGGRRSWRRLVRIAPHDSVYPRVLRALGRRVSAHTVGRAE